MRLWWQIPFTILEKYDEGVEEFFVTFFQVLLGANADSEKSQASKMDLFVVIISSF